MYLMHYILPGIIYYFKRSKVMLWGLLSANLIDLDHIYMRIIGKAPWFGSACPGGLGTNCSIGIYPLHNPYLLIPFAMLSIIMILIYGKHKNKWILFFFWLGVGYILHMSLDYIQMVTGFAI